jgi:hypothetical protein
MIEHLHRILCPSLFLKVTILSSLLHHSAISRQPSPILSPSSHDCLLKVSMRCCSCTVHARTASVGIPPRPVEVTSHGSLKEAQPDIAAAVETDSHFTSARTADLRDIQTIFTSARDGERLSQTLTDKDTNTTKHLGLAARLLKKLSKDKKVDPATTDGAVKLTELKRDIRKNLLNGQSPTQGGYDSDAPEIATVHGSVSQLRQNEGLARGRSLVRRTNVRNYEWASPGPRSGHLPPSSVIID